MKPLEIKRLQPGIPEDRLNEAVKDIEEKEGKVCGVTKFKGEYVLGCVKKDRRD